MRKEQKCNTKEQKALKIWRKKKSWHKLLASWTTCEEMNESKQFGNLIPTCKNPLNTQRQACGKIPVEAGKDPSVWTRQNEAQLSISKVWPRRRCTPLRRDLLLLAQGMPRLSQNICCTCKSNRNLCSRQQRLYLPRGNRPVSFIFHVWREFVLSQSYICTSCRW